ncbi:MULTISPECIES: MetQ/NlpA family ABC transporter substrate-binding protein [unclassified Thermoanaerobacterium]|uniref:MetQ/NlpA family ABC transporter substrate-binding protein n=1 Tax=unclassified Thermoanaerobacterium TaxID=2622527 RepID=UPI000A156F8D|nr:MULTISPECIES: MetQ/NlpA family ABC transporter substrate-binding protein [unclassified Thermoanaerobacterium]MDE4542443.1 MetQ/NlpA family ABC transporter substrate-binding protein [Thermoanaerobacterium sp. R66]ORX24437.1 methionine ABC transporter substrate-binding protein [Thermoanaerobacterium sp. PSU-2]HHV73872.1 MetQ/NlpA family ABC transporter substrate-binding protein [Thermoanaerobacterium sp.]
MKKSFLFLTLILTFAFILSGCTKSNNTAATSNANSNTDTSTKMTKIVVGATPNPHAEILNVVKPILAKEGVDLEIKEFTDYVTPNTALVDKQIDANFFQHVPYLEDFEKKNNVKLVPLVKVHVEPMGAYSKKIKSKDELKDGATVAVPNDATNEGRALLLLQKEGLIKLKDPNGLTQTPRDIVDNPKHLKIVELEAPQLPRTLQDVDLAIINTNFALEANLNPLKDAIFMEDKNSPYANVLVVREDNQNDPAIQKLAKALNSDEVKKFIEDKYKGAIVPAF